MLNPMQEKFCVEYVASGNGKASYMKAFEVSNSGTARVQASKLLHRPDIQTRLKELNAEIADSDICSAREIQKRLSQIARRELYETITLPNGAQVQKQTSIRDACRALEMLGKINQMFVAKSEVELNGTLPVVILRDDI